MLKPYSSISLSDENEIKRLNTFRKINEIQSREIEAPKDLISMIQYGNSIIKEQKDFLSKKVELEGESLFDVIFDEIDQNTASTNHHTENKIENLILEQIILDLEYYIAYSVSGLQDIQKKRDRFKYALTYTELKFCNRNETELKEEAEISGLPKGWINFFGPIIDSLLTPQMPSISEEGVLLYPHKTKKLGDHNITNLDSNNLELFQQYCESIINKNYRSEYRLGKDILRELGEGAMMPLQ